MCRAMREIKATRPKDNKDLWKLPYQMIEKYEQGTSPMMLVKCGKCYECKKERGRNWTYKIWLEALNHKDKCFITLTYANDYNGSRQVNKKELQNFIKRLRKNENIPKGMKYFAAGEYGEKKGRAHYHIIILGWKPDDIKKWYGAKSRKGFPLYTSKKISKLWGKGITTIQEFAYKEVGYLTLYINNNSEINYKLNAEEIRDKRIIKEQLELKHGIREKYIDLKGNIKTHKILNIKDLETEKLKQYKKEYNEKLYQYKMKVENEFNLYSQGMGWKTYIEKEYWKYDLIIDGYKFERPKEFLRKILEKPEEYSEEIYHATIMESIKRKQFMEENWEELTNEKLANARARERNQDNINNMRLYKIHDSHF